MNRQLKKEVVKYSISIVFWITFLVVATVVWYMPRQNLQNSYAYAMGNDSFYLEELNDGINMQNIYPVSDQVGKKGDSLAFQIVNKLDQDISYQLYFKNDVSKLSNVNKKLDSRYLRYQLLENGEEVAVDNLPEDGKIYLSTVKANSNVYYELRIWLDYDADYGFMGKEFCGIIGLDTAYPNQEEIAIEW